MMRKHMINTQLKPVLSLFGYSTSLPEETGTYKCKIHVDKGDILFRHGAYNLQTGGWDDKPDGDEITELLLHEGETKEFEVNCGEHYGQPDNLLISNNSYLKSARFSCAYTKINESQKDVVEKQIA